MRAVDAAGPLESKSARAPNTGVWQFSARKLIECVQVCSVIIVLKFGQGETASLHLKHGRSGRMVASIASTRV